MSIDVVKPGALTTLQDLGRRGFQALGVPVSGAMDERSHRLANALVGNAPGDGTLEVTLMGPALRFTSDAVIAVTGADLDAKWNGEPVPMNRAIPVSAGGELTFGRRGSGVRAYIAVRGGYRAVPVMGSTSLFARGGFGGFDGKALAKGAVIEVKDTALAEGRSLDRGLAAFDQDVLADAQARIRVLAGREWTLFDETARQAFQREAFRLSPRSDRMGFRLEGPTLALTQAMQLASEAVGFGTIQVPADGNPIVLMADRQTTGGYPRIGQVCAVDLPRLAQSMPGESIRFRVIGIDDAQRLLLSQERTFAAWRD